jgi:hypothetical protein
MLNIISEFESPKNELYRLSYDSSKLRVMQWEILEYAAQSVRFCLSAVFLTQICLEKLEHETKHPKVSNKTNYAMFGVHKR